MHKLHILYVYNLLELHIYIFILKTEGYKMIRNIINFLNTNYTAVNDYNYESADPQLVRYFRNEYGKDWRSALTEHLYNKRAKNDKKAA